MQEHIEKLSTVIDHIILHTSDRQIAQELKRYHLYFLITMQQAEHAQDITTTKIHYAHAQQLLISIEVCCHMLNEKIESISGQIKRELKNYLAYCEQNPSLFN